jgi:hypothetical protein
MCTIWEDACRTARDAAEFGIRKGEACILTYSCVSSFLLLVGIDVIGKRGVL